MVEKVLLIFSQIHVHVVKANFFYEVQIVCLGQWFYRSLCYRMCANMVGTAPWLQLDWATSMLCVASIQTFKTFSKQSSWKWSLQSWQYLLERYCWYSTLHSLLYCATSNYVVIYACGDQETWRNFYL